MTEQAAPQPKGKSKTPWWAYAIVLAIIGAVALVASRPVHHEPTAEDKQADAQRACEEQFIPDRLKAPATAKYSGVTVTFDGASYMVAGSVDSENSFGALVRSPFTCSVQLAGDHWTLNRADVAG